jgi:hypothetical protein
MVFTIACFLSCKESKVKPEITSEKTIHKRDSLDMKLIADTIIYDVIIKNPDPDNEWIKKCLGNLKRTEFIDKLFDAVYNKETFAYDFFSGKEIKPRDLKKIEKEDGFNREQIGKLQFTETWYYNSQNLIMDKKIISITLGHEISENNGDIIGYKPVFKIKLN